ncbi:MAG TPA: hypothetical protein VGB90_05680 [Alphaproteobacteria bacterium]
MRALEGAQGLAAGQGVALGLPLLDRHLPWGGLPRGALHEVLAGDAGSATLFAVALAARLAGSEGDILWCIRAGALDAGLPCPAGLAAIGLDPARLVLVTARNDADALWAMEEGLRSRAVAAVIGEAVEASLTATRRLALAAEANGAAFLLRPDAGDPPPSAAATRWRIAAAPAAPDTGLPPALSRVEGRFRAELFRCRGGAPGAWLMGWCDEAGGLAVSAALHGGAADPAPARLAG